MPKRVELTWTYNGYVMTEKCTLCHYDAPLYTFDGELVPKDVYEDIMKQGFVMFEDDEGLFCLRAEQIVKMRILKDKK
jgi:hypothetical protein